MNTIDRRMESERMHRWRYRGTCCTRPPPTAVPPARTCTALLISLTCRFMCLDHAPNSNKLYVASSGGIRTYDTVTHAVTTVPGSWQFDACGIACSASGQRLVITDRNTAGILT